MIMSLEKKWQDPTSFHGEDNKVEIEGNFLALMEGIYKNNPQNTLIWNISINSLTLL